jgi:hypothetical protein
MVMCCRQNVSLGFLNRLSRSTRVICEGERPSMEHNRDFPELDKPMKDHSRFQDFNFHLLNLIM